MAASPHCAERSSPAWNLVSRDFSSKFQVVIHNLLSIQITYLHVAMLSFGYIAVCLDAPFEVPYEPTSEEHANKYEVIQRSGRAVVEETTDEFCVVLVVVVAERLVRT